MNKSSSLFDVKVKSKRRDEQISIKSPKDFRESIYNVKHDSDGYTKGDQKGLYLAQNRAKSQLYRKNLSDKERKEFMEISNIKIPQVKTPNL